MVAIPEEENDRDSHRTLILALAGFSFTGLIGIAVVDATIQTHLEYAVYFLFVSFLSFFFSLNLQGYKFRRWHDQLSDALIEAATLSLMACIAVIALKIYPATFVAYFIAISAALVWGLDFLLRISRMAKYLKAVEFPNRNQIQKSQTNLDRNTRQGIQSLSLAQLRKRFMYNKNQDDNSRSADDQILEAMIDSVTFIYCPLHDIQYPKGAPCPMCVQILGTVRENKNDD